MIEEALTSILKADAGLTALTSAVRPFALFRSDELPAVTYQLIGRPTYTTYDDAESDRYYSARIQIDCWSTKYTQAAALSEAVNDALQSFRGSSDDVFIMRATIEDLADLPQAPDEGDDNPIYGRRIDVLLNYYNL